LIKFKVVVTHYFFFILQIMVKQPAFVQVGARIAVVAPSGTVDATLINRAIVELAELGFQIIPGKHLYTRVLRFAGTPKDRLEDVQSALDNPDIDIVWCARGGYGCQYLIDQLRWDKFNEKPKWLIGFSDITALLIAAHQNGFAAIHGPVLQQWPQLNNSSKAALVKLLEGNLVPLYASSDPLNRNGDVIAPVIGGNLSMIVSAIGTKYPIQTANSILVLEEVSEPMYKIDRMMLQLKRAGLLDQLAGLAVGHFTNISTDALDQDWKIQEVIASWIPTHIPLAFGFPFGHESANMPIIVGRSYRFHVGESGAILEQQTGNN
jgi:muramoyltetrapeptide carboxypeptidase